MEMLHVMSACRYTTERRYLISRDEDTLSALAYRQSCYWYRCLKYLLSSLYNLFKKICCLANDDLVRENLCLSADGISLLLWTPTRYYSGRVYRSQRLQKKNKERHCLVGVIPSGKEDQIKKS